MLLSLQRTEIVEKELHLRDLFLPEDGEEKTHLGYRSLPRKEQSKTTYDLHGHDVSYTAMSGPLALEKGYNGANNRRGLQNKVATSTEEENTRIYLVSTFGAENVLTRYVDHDLFNNNFLKWKATSNVLNIVASSLN